MSHAVLRCTGQPPSSPGPRRHCPQLRTFPPAVAPRAGGNAHLATPPKPKSGFKLKLNASVAAPGTIGPWPAGRLAWAWRSTGARASAGKTLASPGACELQAFFDSVKQSSIELIC